ncbi:MAG TPA: PD-(D/E)XK nuclease family protein, partial [Synergistaceae bacterium]|nr:PD-(D/E)XK nuclease family protein [Synergistaceae bacterium]
LEEKSWEEEGGGEPLREGTFLHRLWELVWQTPGAGEGEISLEELVDHCWDRALEPEEESSSGHPYEGYRALRDDPRCAPRARFLRFAARRMGRLQDQAEESRRKEGVAVINRLRESVNPRIVVDGVTFSGRCDRVDLTSQGALLLDYKLGNVAGKKIRRLQLAAYALALEEGRLSGENPLPGGQEIRGFAYLGHRDGKAQGEMEPPFYRWYGMKSSGSLDVAMAEAREALESMAGALQEGKYPANYASENCAWCPYPALCRRGESQGEGMGEDQGDEDEIQEGA